MSEGEGVEETEREQEMLGFRRRKAGPLRRGHSGCWRGRRGGTSGTGGAAEVAKAGVYWVTVRVIIALLHLRVILGAGAGPG